MRRRRRHKVQAGSAASGLALLSGGVLIDDGEVIGGAGTLAGTLSGSGSIIETGGGDLRLSALAAFAPMAAANAALVSSPSPTGQTPFLDAAASATAGRL